MPVSLTPRERTHLKGRAHALEPIVQVGQGGLSDAVALELERALTAHGLIKVKGALFRVTRPTAPTHALRAAHHERTTA